MTLVENIYRLTESFPKTEVFGLTSQMRRSAVSIPSNIAERNRRSTKKDYRQFVTIAFGSGAELETQLEIAQRLKFVNDEKVSSTSQLLNEVMRMLNGLIASLQQ